MTGSEAIGATLDGVLETAAGRKYPADLVIGADGVNSKVRKSLGIKMEREVYGDGITRLLVERAPEEVANPEWNRVIDFWTRTPGPRRILYTPCNDSELYLAFMAPRTDAEGAEVPRAIGQTRQLGEVTHGWPLLPHPAPPRAPRG